MNKSCSVRWRAFPTIRCSSACLPRRRVASFLSIRWRTIRSILGRGCGWKSSFRQRSTVFCIWMATLSSWATFLHSGMSDLCGALLGTVDIPGAQRGVTISECAPRTAISTPASCLSISINGAHPGPLIRSSDMSMLIPNECAIDVDQEALNACFHGRKKRLDYKWNVVWSFFRTLRLATGPRRDRSNTPGRSNYSLQQHTQSRGVISVTIRARPNMRNI